MTANKTIDLRTALLTGFLLLGTFVAGLVSGIGVAFWLFPQPGYGHPKPKPDAPPLPRPGPPPGPFGAMHALDLSPAQQQQAQAIKEKYHPQMEAIIKKTFPELRSLNDQVAKELRAILQPAQQARFDAIQKVPPPPPGPRPPGPGMRPAPEGFRADRPPPFERPEFEFDHRPEAQDNP